MGQQNDRHHGPHDRNTNPHPAPALVVYVHAIGCGGTAATKATYSQAP